MDEHVNCLVKDIQLTPADRIICSHNDDVNRYNDSMLEHVATEQHPIVATPPKLQTQPPVLGAAHVPLPRDQLDDVEAAWVDGHKANRLTRVCIGARVRFTSTNTSSGYTNAGVGTVVGFNPADDAPAITGIRVRKDGTNRVVSVNRLSPEKKYANRRFISAAFWPLQLAYAATVHGVQGASLLCRLYLKISCFVHGLAYTALSRNTDTDQIFLAAPLTVADLRVVDPAAYYEARDAGLVPTVPPRHAAAGGGVAVAAAPAPPPPPAAAAPPPAPPAPPPP